MTGKRLNMNMNIKSRYYLIVIALILGLCPACSGDDFNIPGHGYKDGLTLCVPVSGQFASRATDATGGELAYSSLTFIAYPKDGSKPYVQYLKSSEGTLTFEPTFTSYALDLPRGTYRFYLLANFMPEGTTVPQTEKDLLDATGSAVYVLPGSYSCGIPRENELLLGLPMSASHGDFFMQDENESQVLLPNDADGYYYYDGKGGNLYAVLTFMFAKISVNATDATGEAATIIDIKVHNISEQVPAFRLDGFDYGTESGPIALNETTSLVFYVPERYVAADTPESQTSVTFKIGENDIMLPLGQTVDQEAGNKYELPGEDSYRFIARGMHYSYNLFTNDRIILEVKDWSPEEIAVANASVYLHIENMVYPIASGEKTAIWFDSNAKNVKIESPKFEGISLYDYSIDPNQDTIRVWVNDTIPSSKFNEIKESIQNDEGKYDYFHIVAGNIHKRIKVTPLKLEYFLDVDPESMSIIVSLRVASGVYSDTLPVSIHTNYPKVKVTPTEGWNSLPTDAPDALQLLNPIGSPVGGGSEADVVNGYADYGVAFKGLNSGYNVWKDDRTLTFTVTGLDDDGKEMENVPVTVTIVPNILNYKIHFKPGDNNWENPHIYVYQCLEFPADYTPALASQPIGYIDSKGQNYYAALEYSFTGAMAFRGWDYPGNFSVLYNADGTPKDLLLGQELYKREGFYVFKNAVINNSWNADFSYTPETQTRYNFDMDFAAIHRDEIAGNGCSLCGNEATRNRLWPGIRMKKEEDGWYEFELTGIATPGKALIMFANGHIPEEVKGRFPGASAPGVPLFDYPTKEGWLFFNGDVNDRVDNQFLPYIPEKRIIKYRIFWPKIPDRYQVWSWIKDSDRNLVGTWNNGVYIEGEWNSSGFSMGASDDYYYFDFETYASSAPIFMMFHSTSAGTSAELPTSLTIFKDINGIRCAYYNGSQFESGEPPLGTHYRFYWPKNINNTDYQQMHLYSAVDNLNKLIPWTIGYATGTAGAYNYCDFWTSNSVTEPFRVIFHNLNVESPSYGPFTLSDFALSPDGDVHCAYYSNGSIMFGEPPVN